MNNQVALNSVELSVAAQMISDELIKEKYALEKKLETLYEYKRVYEQAYIKASADGDFRENAPLDAAIESLRHMTGEIGNSSRVLQNMQTIEDVQYLIGTYNFSELLGDLHIASQGVQQVIYNAAGSQLDDVVVNMFRNMPLNEMYALCEHVVAADETGNIATNERNFKFLADIVDFYQVANKPQYNTCGVVVPYTTVRLELNGRLLTYRIYPEFISFIDIGVMAANARVARAIIGKHKGDFVNVRHDSRGTLLRYDIVDIY